MTADRKTWRINVVPEARWYSGMILAGWLVIVAVAVGALTVTQRGFGTDDADRVFWISVLIAAVVAMGATAVVRIRFVDGLSGRGRTPKHAAAWGVGRAAIWEESEGKVIAGTARTFGNATLRLDDQTLELDGGQTVTSWQLREIQAVEVLRVIPGLGFAPVISIRTVSGHCAQFVLLFGNVAGLFGGRTREIRAAAETILQARNFEQSP
jgi:hypothetical protein